MTDNIHFAPAAAFSLGALAGIFTQAFEGYYYAQTLTGAMFAATTRLESLDLHYSPVMLSGAEPCGLAVLGLRGERAWCGGFGIAAPMRGAGLATRLVAEMLGQARAAGAGACVLEVLTRNDRAIRTYARAGFHTTRDLQIFEWLAPEGQEPAHQAPAPALVERAPARLLERFAELHPVPAAWQRDLPSLLVRGRLRGLALMEGGRSSAYALLAETADGGARIEDLGAEGVEQAAALVRALQRRYARIFSVNEPADSPLSAALDASGFVERDRQHEMAVQL